jgi:hypothetical protein
MSPPPFCVCANEIDVESVTNREMIYLQFVRIDNKTTSSSPVVDPNLGHSLSCSLLTVSRPTEAIEEEEEEYACLV